MEPANTQINTNNKPLLPLKFATRGKEGFQMFIVESGTVTKDSRFDFTNCRAMFFNQTGSVLCLVLDDCVEVFDVEDAKQLSKIEKRDVSYAMLSPLGTYLLTWSRPPQQPQQAQKETDHEKEKGGERDKEADNLIVWEVASGKRLWSAFQKIFKRDNWPTIQWCADEKYAGRMVNNQIEFYLGNQLGSIIKKKQLPSVYQWSFSPNVSNNNDQLCYATFVLGKNTNPSSLSLFKFSTQDQISSKSFFHVQSVDFLWNSSGTALIAQTQADVDRTGKSYYGETGLYFFSIDGKTSEQIQLKKEGHVHHCSWAPNSKEFLVIYGFMPALATKFDLQLKPTADFGAAHRNGAFWSPHGRLLAIAGFGNLQGDMDIWDHKRVKKLATTKAHCAAYCGWSPDSNYLLTAVLSPRIRVDNGFKLHSNNGTVLFEQSSAELFEVLWRPAPPGLYSEPPPLKPTVNTTTTTTTTTTTSSDASSPWAPSGVNTPPAAKPGVYRHPHFSQQSSTFKKEDDNGPVKYSRGAGRGAAIPGSTPAQKEYLPPGYTPEVPKKKNKNRRKNKKTNQNESGDDTKESESENDASHEQTESTTTTTTTQESDHSNGAVEESSVPSRGRGRGGRGGTKGEGSGERAKNEGGAGVRGRGRGGRGRGRGEAATTAFPKIEEP